MSFNGFILPDFQTCLRYSIIAKKSFICLAKRRNISKNRRQAQQTDQIDPLSTNNEPGESKKDEENEQGYNDEYEDVEPYANQIQRAVEHHCNNKVILRHIVVLDNITDDLLKKEEEEQINKVATFEIVIIPNINRLTTDEQRVLVKYMRNSCDHEQTRIFIGIVEWVAKDSSNFFNDINNKRNPEDDGLDPNSMRRTGFSYSENNNKDKTKTYQKELKSSITIGDWLRHKFWFACTMPKIESVDSSLSSGYYSEIESLTEKVTSESDEEKIPTSVDFDKIHFEGSLKRYILDIMVHIRIHRLAYHAKGGGAHTNSLSDIILLSKLMSYDLNKTFVTPTQLKQALRWYFPLHLMLINRASMDTSTLYGSKIRLVEEFLIKVGKIKQQKTQELDNPLFLECLVVNDVINKVVPPV